MVPQLCGCPQDWCRGKSLSPEKSGPIATVELERELFPRLSCGRVLVSQKGKQWLRSLLSRTWATVRNLWPAFSLSTFSGWEKGLSSFLLQHIMTLRSFSAQRALCYSLQQSAAVSTSQPAIEVLMCTQCIKLRMKESFVTNQSNQSICLLNEQVYIEHLLGTWPCASLKMPEPHS